MGKSLYKFLDEKGLKSIISCKNGRLKFSSLNEWKKNGDVYENPVSRCFEDENVFNYFINGCKNCGFSRETILARLAYLYILAYKTYALSLSQTANKNSMAMWQIYGNKKGVRIEFDSDLLSYIREKNKGYSVMSDRVLYKSKLDAFGCTFNEQYDKENIKKHIFLKKTNAYAYEREYRIIVTKFELQDVIILELFPHDKSLSIEFEDFKNDLSQYLVDYSNNDDAIFLDGNYIPFIKSVQVSPTANDKFVNKIGVLCDKYKIKYLQRSDILKYEFNL